jgi:5-methylcytosine-specific restriction protein B
LRVYTLLNDEGHKRHVFKNFLDAKKGDKVIGYEATPTLQIVSLLEIESGSDGKSIYFRKKENLKNPIEYAELKDMPELAKMGFMKNPIGSFFKLTADEYDAIMDRIREDNPLTESVTCDKYDEEDFGNEVFISKESISSLRELIKIKKNIILQGAPGVGKTFAARRLAYMMMGEKDMSRVEFVQFHQNYTYEDFIMGYKPDEEGGFRLRRGVFYNFCRKAQADSAKDYFFIIDEINRGNLSKIFGELLMLIENGYRGKEHAVKLAYSDELFFVPENLYLIGMMNTADRSLAMIDYALRRRFSFFEMRPGFDSEGFKKYQADLKNAQFDNIIEAVKQLNIVIEKDDSLGAGFCIGHSYFCNQKEYSKQWMKNVIKYDIKPMLEEYWFDNKNQRESQINNLLTLLND